MARSGRRPRLAWLSLFYVAAYLVAGGIALLAAPDLTLQLMRSTVEYGAVFPRAAGLLLLGLAVIAVQIIRYRIDVLYPTTVVIRCGFLAGFAWLYWMSRDPFFAILFAIIAMGVVLTTTGLIVDWLRKA